MITKSRARRHGAGVGDWMSDPRSPLPRGWMKGAAAPVRGALLGLLLESPAGGGVLTTRLRARLGDTWKVDRSNVYRLLAGLEREGLVRCVNEPRRGENHSTQVIFHPTPITERAISYWMASVLPREPVRRGIEAKLAVATDRDLAGVCRSLRHYRAECLVLAQAMPPAEREPATFSQLAIDCARDAILSGLQAEVGWAEHTLERIREYAAGPQEHAADGS
jgi:DNA-binding PadR family transcriptional regulator